MQTVAGFLLKKLFLSLNENTVGENHMILDI